MLTLLLTAFAALLYVVLVDRNLPGPWHTAVTSLALRWHSTKGRRLWTHRLHLKYGTVVRLAPNEVSFASYEAMQEIYLRNGGYDKSAFYDQFQPFHRRTMFSTLDRQTHTARRRMFGDFYSMANVSKHEERIQGLVEKVVQQCHGVVDVYQLMLCYALDCASLMIFGETIDSLGSKEGRRVMEAMTFGGDAAEEYVRRAMRLSLQGDATEKSVMPLSDRSQGNAAEKSVMPLSDRLQLGAAKYIKQEGPLSDQLQLDADGIAAELLDNLAAGIDTTGVALCYMVYELSKRPELQDELSKRSQLQGEPSKRHELQGEEYDLPKRPESQNGECLDWVIKEGLRLCPAIPMALPRVVPEDRMIDGYLLKKGTVVSCQAHTLHRQIDRPDEFLPERWRGDSENKLWMPFGLGSRGCAGKNLAMLEMRMLLKGVYERFRTSVVDEMVIEDLEITSRPKGQRCLVEFRPVCDEQD